MELLALLYSLTANVCAKLHQSYFLQHLTYLCIGDFLGALMSIIISAGAMVRDDFFPAPEGRGLLG